MAKPTKPAKRKLVPSTDKVMPERGPREAVRRIAPTGTASDSAGTDTSDVDESGAPLTGTRARRAAQAEKAAEATGRRSRRRNRRVTEKGTVPSASARYTPPNPHYEDLPSPLWVPVLMFTLLGLGMLTIILNYVGLVPGGTSNWYLLLGLGFILGGIITATQLR